MTTQQTFIKRKTTAQQPVANHTLTDWQVYAIFNVLTKETIAQFFEKKDISFVNVLSDYYNQRGGLTPSQLSWAKKLIAPISGVLAGTLIDFSKVENQQEYVHALDGSAIPFDGARIEVLAGRNIKRIEKRLPKAIIPQDAFAKIIVPANSPLIRRTAPLLHPQIAQTPTELLKTIELVQKAITPMAIFAEEPPPKTIKFLRGGREIEITPDASQSAAVAGVEFEQFACITGAAGTGKTTVERIIVKQLEDKCSIVDIRNYAKTNPDPDAETKKVPALAFAAYTGKAMQQMKKALSEDYHKRCYTIHSLLGFHPIFEEYEVYGENGRPEIKVKKKFVPWFTAANKMPWQIIILDEASMIPITLWEQFIAACQKNTRLILIGDINQLPPVHGRSVFGFAMLQWPSFELTQIHRQKGENNPIVDNAWRILRGEFPQTVPGRFDMIRIAGGGAEAFDKITKAAILLYRKGEFDPIDKDDKHGDMIILGQNKGIVGQPEVNLRLIPFFNPPPAAKEIMQGKREIVIAGWEKRLFAVGDKVMATINDHDIGITNGMTGHIIDIARNGSFSGRYGKMQLTARELEDILSGDFKLEMPSLPAESSAEKEDATKRQASHIITVDFGIRENGERITVEFSTAGGVNSLIHAYAATCHKCQGSEFPTVIVLCHSANHRMLYREWLYTAVTRASERIILVYDDKGLSLALNRQKIVGKNLKEKAKAFIELQEGNTDFLQPTIPETRRINN